MLLTKRYVNRIIGVSIVSAVLLYLLLFIVFARGNISHPIVSSISAVVLSTGGSSQPVSVSHDPVLPVIERLPGGILVHRIMMNKDNRLLEEMETITTGDTGAVHLIFDGVSVVLAPNSQMQLVKIDDDTLDVRLLLLEGSLFADVYRPLSENENFEVYTPATSVSVLGTAIHVNHDAGNGFSEVGLLKGYIAVTCLASGQTATHFSPPGASGLMVKVSECGEFNINETHVLNIENILALEIALMLPSDTESMSIVADVVNTVAEQAELNNMLQEEFSSSEISEDWDFYIPPFIGDDIDVIDIQEPPHVELPPPDAGERPELENEQRPEPETTNPPEPENILESRPEDLERPPEPETSRPNDTNQSGSGNSGSGDTNNTDPGDSDPGDISDPGVGGPGDGSPNPPPSYFENLMTELIALALRPSGNSGTRDTIHEVLYDYSVLHKYDLEYLLHAVLYELGKRGFDGTNEGSNGNRLFGHVSYILQNMPTCFDNLIAELIALAIESSSHSATRDAIHDVLYDYAVLHKYVYLEELLDAVLCELGKRGFDGANERTNGNRLFNHVSNILQSMSQSYFDHLMTELISLAIEPSSHSATRDAIHDVLYAYATLHKYVYLEELLDAVLYELGERGFDGANERTNGNRLFNHVSNILQSMSQSYFDHLMTELIALAVEPSSHSATRDAIHDVLYAYATLHKYVYLEDLLDAVLYELVKRGFDGVNERTNGNRLFNHVSYILRSMQGYTGGRRRLDSQEFTFRADRLSDFFGRFHYSLMIMNASNATIYAWEIEFNTNSTIEVADGAHMWQQGDRVMLSSAVRNPPAWYPGSYLIIEVSGSRPFFTNLQIYNIAVFDVSDNNLGPGGNLGNDVLIIYEPRNDMPQELPKDIESPAKEPEEPEYPKYPYGYPETEEAKDPAECDDPYEVSLPCYKLQAKEPECEIPYEEQPVFQQP